jgi:hypothetical protein
LPAHTVGLRGPELQIQALRLHPGRWGQCPIPAEPATHERELGPLGDREGGTEAAAATIEFKWDGRRLLVHSRAMPVP